MAKPTAANRLDAARKELEATNSQLSELEAKRNSALLADDDRTAAKLAGQIDDLHRLARGHADKIRLLEGEAERAEKEARIRRREDHIRRVEKLLADRDAAGHELADAV